MLKRTAALIEARLILSEFNNYFVLVYIVLIGLFLKHVTASPVVEFFAGFEEILSSQSHLS